MCDLATALQLAKSVPIFPCAPDKKPLTPRGFKDATQDPAIITHWWKRWPNALPAQPTGISTTVVTDLDVKDGTPAADRARAFFNGHQAPPTLIYETVSGGWHIHFAAARPTKNSVEKLAPNVDFRGDGGYVVRWDAEGCRVLCDEGPAPIPEWLFDRVKADRRPKADQAPTGTDIGEGRRNATLASMAGAMRRRGMSVATIEAALLAENAARCNPPLPDAEVRQIAASVGRYAPAAPEPEPETEPPDWRFDAPPLEDEHRREDPRAGDTKGSLVPIGDLLTDVQPIPWLVKQILQRDSLAVFYGPPESWKSLVTLDIGLSVAAGLPSWCGHRVKPGIVVYVCGEGLHGVKLRAMAWMQRNEVDPARVRFVVARAPVGVLDVEAITRLRGDIRAACGGEPPALVIFDTLQRNFGPGDENSTGDMSKFIGHLDAFIRLPFECCVLVVHHTGQADKTRARGSSVLKAAVDIDFSFTKADGIVTMACTKMKDGRAPDDLGFTLESHELPGIYDEDGNIETAPALLATDPPRKTKALGKAQLAVLDALNELSDSQPGYRVGWKTLRAASEKNGVSRSGVFAAVKSLMDYGLVQHVGSEVWLC